MIKKYPYKTRAEFLKARRLLQGVGQRDIFRLGASEVGNIYNIEGSDKVGLNEYCSPTVFFYNSCELFPYSPTPTLEMIRGSIQESVIYNKYWKYFNPENPTADAFIDNYYGDQKVYRKAIKSNGIVINDKYPNLFASLDYRIVKNNTSLSGPLELKSLSWRVCEKYAAGIPTANVVQIHNQIMIMEDEYGELFNVLDATTPQLYQFGRSENIEQNIHRSTKDFIERVLAAKKIVYSRKSQLRKEQEVGKLAPVDDGHSLYTEFLKERHKPENTKLIASGTPEQFKVVVEYLKLKKRLKANSKNLLQKENEIRSWYTKGIGGFEWPDFGQITWKEKFNCDIKLLRNI